MNANHLPRTWSWPSLRSCGLHHVHTTTHVPLPGAAITVASLRPQKRKPQSWVCLGIVGSDRDRDSREGHLSFWLWQMNAAPASVARPPPPSALLLLAAGCPAYPSCLEPNPQSRLPPRPLLPLAPSTGRPWGERLFSVQFSACLWLRPQVNLPEKSCLASSCRGLTCFCWTQAGDDFQTLVTRPAVTLISGMALAELLGRTVTTFFFFLFLNLDNAVYFFFLFF